MLFVNSSTVAAGIAYIATSFWLKFADYIVELLLFSSTFCRNKVFHKIRNRFSYHLWIPTKTILKYKNWIGILKKSSSSFNNYSRIKISKINIPFFLKILLTKIYRVKKRLNFENACNRLPPVRPKRGVNAKQRGYPLLFANSSITAAGKAYTATLFWLKFADYIVELLLFSSTFFPEPSFPWNYK